MAKSSPQITSFTSGELSPRLEGRTDLDKYNTGCKQLKNFLVHPHGGASRRPGTEYILSPDTNQNTRILPFEYSAEDTYALVFEGNFFSVIRNGEEVVYTDAWRRPYREFKGRANLEQQCRDRGVFANADGFEGSLTWDFNSGMWTWNEDGTYVMFAYTDSFTEEGRLFPNETQDTGDRWTDFLYLTDYEFFVMMKASVPYSLQGLNVESVYFKDAITTAQGNIRYSSAYSSSIEARAAPLNQIHKMTPDGRNIISWLKDTENIGWDYLLSTIIPTPYDLNSVRLKPFVDYNEEITNPNTTRNIVDFCFSGTAKHNYCCFSLHANNKIFKWSVDTYAESVGPEWSGATIDVYAVAPQELNLVPWLSNSGNASNWYVTGISCNAAGTKIWVSIIENRSLTRNRDTRVFEISLSTPFDLSTATSTYGSSSLTFYRDEYIHDDNNFDIYNELSTDWKLFTCAHVAEHDGKYIVTSNPRTVLAKTNATFPVTSITKRINYKELFFDGPWQVVLDGTTLSSETSFKYPKVTFPHSFSPEELDSMRYAQVADTMYLVHQNNYPVKIVRKDHDDWEVTAPDFRHGPMLDPVGFQDNGLDAVTTEVELNTGYIKVTANQDLFRWSDVGRLIQTHYGWGRIAYLRNADFRTERNKTEPVTDEVLVTITDTVGEFQSLGFVPRGQGTIKVYEGDPSNTGIEHNDRVSVIISSERDLIKLGYQKGQIVSVFNNFSDYSANDFAGQNPYIEDALVVEVTQDTLILAPSIDVPVSGATPHTIASGVISVRSINDPNTRLGAFSKTTGYPSSITLFEQRLVLASTPDNPQSIYFSTAGLFEDFKQGTDADNSISYTIGSNSQDRIIYLQPARTLILGTSGGEFSVSSSSGSITPTTTSIIKQASYGSADTQPVTAGNITLFVQKSGRKIRELVYDFNSDSYYAPDLTLLAEHITQSGIKEIAYQQEPDQIVWVVLDNGKLLGMTYRREENVVAWHEHTLGGSYGDDDWGHVVSVTSVRTGEDEEDLYLIVKRTIDGAEKWFVERLDDINPLLDNTEPYFVDCGIKFEGLVFNNTLSNLDHLEGEELAIMVNGAVRPNATVTNGTINIGETEGGTQKVQLGLPYTSVLETMRLDYGGEEGTSQAKNKRIREVTLRLYETGVGLKVGSQEGEIQELYFRDTNDAMNEPVAIFSGDKTIEFAGGFDSDARIYVEQSNPVPTTILAIYPLMQTWDK